MKSLKNQLLRDDLNFARKEIKEYRLKIEELRKENEELKRQLEHTATVEYIGHLPKKPRDDY
ncbi:hypothetical protein [Rossellomorea marisflavi]|uniref:hypothetical protein n=1 Tax=Rossellomorea marisflavi TaxID=189381 RepID=UPI003FA08006